MFVMLIEVRNRDIYRLSSPFMDVEKCNMLKSHSGLRTCSQQSVSVPATVPSLSAPIPLAFTPNASTAGQAHVQVCLKRRYRRKQCIPARLGQRGPSRTVQVASSAPPQLHVSTLAIGLNVRRSYSLISRLITEAGNQSEYIQYNYHR